MAHTPMARWRARSHDYPHRVVTEPGSVRLTDIRVRDFVPILFAVDGEAGVDRWGFKTAEAAQAFMRTYGGRLDG